MKTRLLYKLFGTYLLIGVLAMIIAGFAIEDQVKSGLTRWIEEDLIAETRILALMPGTALAKQVSALAERSRSRITLIDAGGRVMADSDPTAIQTDNHLNRSEIQEARLKGKGTAIRYSHTLKIDSLYVALPLKQGATISGYIRLARPLSEVNQAIDQFRKRLLQIFLLVVVCAMILALIFSLRMVAPVRKMAEFTEKIRKGDLSGVLMIASRDEMGQLANNINNMVSELQNRINTANEDKWRLRAAFDSMVEGVMVLDVQQRIERINRGMAEMIGQGYADVVGKTPLEVFRNLALQDALHRSLQTGQAVLQEITLKDGNPLILDVTVSPIRSLPGQDAKTMLVFHDVTRLKKLERMRVDFVANVTHEIKTPLTAIIGFVETLEQGAMDERPQAQKFLRIIHENARRLNRLVDDLLTLSNIELGETVLHPEGLAPSDLLEEALALIQARAAVKRLIVRTDLSAELPLIRADRDKAVQILLNILDNAVKFTPEGGQITISAAEETDSVTFRIADTGPGIPKSDLPRLGERFYRVDKMRSRDMGGTGLGLSIVKHLMKAHQGEMRIDSTPGSGVMVSLTFPIF